MTKKFALAAAIMFVVAFATGFIVHGVLLSSDYAKLSNIMRPPSEAHARMPLMVLAYISFALAFTWIYVKGRENKPWLAQGLRYGAAMAALAVVPVYLIYHVVAPYPLDLAVKQIVLESIVTLLMGAVLAWLYR